MGIQFKRYEKLKQLKLCQEKLLKKTYIAYSPSPPPLPLPTLMKIFLKYSFQKIAILIF